MRLHLDLLTFNSLHTQQLALSRLAATDEKAGYFTSSMRLSLVSCGHLRPLLKRGRTPPQPMSARAPLPLLSPLTRLLLWVFPACWI